MDVAAAFAAALATQTAGDLAGAERAYLAILATTPGHLNALHNLGVLYEAGGRFDEAAAMYHRAAAIAPDRPFQQRTVANHYRIIRQFARAEPEYRRLLELAPQDDAAALELGVVLLAQGRMEGWRHYDRREPRRNMLRQNLQFPEWRGEPLAGKRLFVYREQGFGDQIMAARFLPKLGAAEITYMGPRALKRLFEPLGVRWLDWSAGRVELAAHDYWTLPYSIPRHFGGPFPAGAYLAGDATRAQKPAGARIGVVWRGEPANENDRYRSLPPEQARQLLALPGAMSLDPAESGAEDFQATADLIAALDLVITVDTAVAHLAGAMGKPVWVLLARHAVDWQWPRPASSAPGASPWYPSARLFVQPAPGDWAGAVDAVLAEAGALPAVREAQARAEQRRADFDAAVTAHRAGDRATAERGYRAILATTEHQKALRNLALILEDQGRFDEAAEALTRATVAAPGDPQAHRALANHLRMSRRFAAAEAAYRRALALAPGDDDIATHLGLALLAQDRAEGWAYYDRRAARMALLGQALPTPEWRGEPPAGKRLFVYREQGFGDQIMMARYLPKLADAQVTYMGPPALRRLFAPLPLRWIDWSPGANDVGPQDYWILPCSLPQHFPGDHAAAPYLGGEAGRSPAPVGARIGVAWRGNPGNANDIYRTLPDAQAQRLLALPGAISLDPADSGAEDFQATADRIAGLDLVIAADSAVAHLAGAMGKPVWTLLAAYAADWHWPRQGVGPWYPTARPFAQARAGDWAGVVDAVLAAAAAL